MAEVAASVALAERGAMPTMSFVDGDGGADPAAAILDEVLGGEAAPTDGEQPAPAAAADGAAGAPEGGAAAPAVAEPPKTDPPKPADDAEAVKLRRGFAKLAEEKQKLIELQNAARSDRAAAQQYAAKAQKHDEIVSALEKDPAGFLMAHGGEGLVQKALQGFIDMEKSPAEREVAKFRAEQSERDAKAQRQEQEAVASRWRNDIITKVQADERFDLVNSLGLHGEVIDIMTGYYEKYSERDDKGQVTKPAILPWDTAAQAAEDHRASMLDKSKRYGKRAPVTAEPAKPPVKDAPPAKPAAAPAKKAPTSLSSVPVADTPSTEEDLPDKDMDERERRVLAELGL